MRYILIALASLVLLAAAAVAGGTYILWEYGRNLPDYQQLADYQPPVVSRVHAGDGSLLREFATERRVFVPLDSIPARVQKAFIAAEDNQFFAHPGLDWRGIARAVVHNAQAVFTDDRLIGGSTITQQVAKNFLLTDARTLRRKIEEAILSLRIERAFSKREILELYLNEIYLGRGSYGVASAALNYFDKAMSELTVAEAAFLAGLPKAPANYEPRDNPDRAIARRNYVVAQMRENGFITPEEARAARQAPIDAPGRGSIDQAQGDYFVEAVRRRIQEGFGDDRLYEGGLSVRTTLEPRLQQSAEEALRNGLEAYDRRHGWRGAPASLDDFAGWQDKLADKAFPGRRESWRKAVVLKVQPEVALLGFADGTRGRLPLAALEWARPALEEGRVGAKPSAVSDVVSPGDIVLVEKLDPASEAAAGEGPLAYGLRQRPQINGAVVAMDPHTGRVLAMTGGYSFARSEFNRVTQAERQPGSAFKPLVYLAALENGFTPADLIMDAPITIEQGGDRGTWKPANYSRRFYGPSTMRVGIERSRNLMTVRLAQYIGMDEVSEMAGRLGVAEDMPLNLANALGAEEVTLLDLTAAYAMMVNGGRRVSPRLMDRIQDRRGDTIHRADQRNCPDCRGVAWRPGLAVPELPDKREQVLDPRHAYQMVSMLKGAVERGTGWRIDRRIDQPIAGKTGTTDNNRDAWFMGFTPDLAVGVYTGFDEPRTLGENETGSRVAGPIFASFMEDALKDQPGVPFRTPDGIRLVHINVDTGERASDPSKDNVVREAFVAGTEPAPQDDVRVLDNPNRLIQASDVEAAGVDAEDTTTTTVEDGAAGEDSGAPEDVDRFRGTGSGTGGLY